jgi:hypothetical protein
MTARPPTFFVFSKDRLAWQLRQKPKGGEKKKKLENRKIINKKRSKKGSVK